MIRTEGLAKYYGQVTALDDLNLEVADGEVFGLLGPNGAGKTTTIKILTTLAKPSAGRAFIQGYDVVSQPLAVKRCIAVCPQEINLDKELTAYENLLIYGKLYRVPDLRKRLWALLEIGSLVDRAYDLVRNFSGGQQRRLLILRALLSRPQVLFLDEPTVGLDPQIRRQIWEMIQQLHQQGITIMVTTHYIEEAEKLCGRVGILNKGRLIAVDTPAALVQQVGGYVVESQDNGRRHYALAQDKNQAYALARLHHDDVTIRQSNLEDVFIQLTGERLQ
ncbi:MAG: ABC transporter ATP-binding protein [Desulfobacca sp.]|uniref:ABC transporter ATP-binding protein n=1 Tax=Desulfobacca sp. TaxID=2067990 RepID=UPI0040492891